MSMIFILIQIKFDIDINNDKLLKNIRRKKWSSQVLHNSVEPKFFI
jgi:hypothetical protein